MGEQLTISFSHFVEGEGRRAACSKGWREAQVARPMAKVLPMARSFAGTEALGASER